MRRRIYIKSLSSFIVIFSKTTPARLARLVFYRREQDGRGRGGGQVRGGDPAPPPAQGGEEFAGFLTTFPQPDLENHQSGHIKLNNYKYIYYNIWKSQNNSISSLVIFSMKLDNLGINHQSHLFQQY